jgi:hypothetical protein
MNKKLSLLKMKNNARRCLRIYTLSLIALLSGLAQFITVHGQEITEGVKVLARPYQDSIQLRWAPTSYELWQAGIKNGYIIERYTILSNKELVRQSLATKKVFDVVKAWPLAPWEPLVDIDKYCGIAAEAMYGENFSVTTGKTGSMYEIVNMATEQSNRYSFAMFSADMSVRAARAMGLMFTDKSASKNESYLYKVRINNYTAQKVDTGYVLTGFLEFRALPRLSHFSANKHGQSIMLTWDRLGAENTFTAYMIERSVGNNDFKPLNLEPLVNPVPDGKDESPFFSYVDTLPSASVNLHYRVCGITPFGEHSVWSDTANITGASVLADNPAITLYESKDAKTATIGWEFPKENKGVTGFRVMRSNTDATGFKDISGLLPVKTRLYTDTMPMPTNYYKVFAVGQSGDITMSLAVLVQPVDSFPPAPPTGLAAKVDSSGKVTLHWKANAESDMFGYRVYRANNLNEEFSQLTIRPVKDTVFYDKINIKTITPHVYYQLMAIDKRQNHSVFSKYLEVKRPDFIPPVPPVFREVSANEKGIFLSWFSSTSTDVALQELYRYAKDTTKQTVVAKFTNMDIETFMDSTASSDTVYHYRFYAIDESHNRSKPATIAAVSGHRANSAITLQAKALRNKGSIELTWNAPAAKNIARYIIYRGVSEEPVSAYTSVNAPTTTFTEKVPVVGTKYTYSVRALFTNGSFGAVSQPVSIEY